MKSGRKPIDDSEKKVNAGVWVKRKNLSKLKPILVKLASELDKKSPQEINLLTFEKISIK